MRKSNNSIIDKELFYQNSCGIGDTELHLMKMCVIPFTIGLIQVVYEIKNSLTSFSHLMEQL